MGHPKYVWLNVNEYQQMKTKSTQILYYLEYSWQSVHSKIQTLGRSLFSIQTHMSTHCCMSRSQWSWDCIYYHSLEMCCKLPHHLSTPEMDNSLQSYNLLSKVTSYFYYCSTTTYDINRII